MDRKVGKQIPGVTKQPFPPVGPNTGSCRSKPRNPCKQRWFAPPRNTPMKHIKYKLWNTSNHVGSSVSNGIKKWNLQSADVVSFCKTTIPLICEGEKIIQMCVLITFVGVQQHMENHKLPSVTATNWKKGERKKMLFLPHLSLFAHVACLGISHMKKKHIQGSQKMSIFEIHSFSNTHKYFWGYFGAKNRKRQNIWKTMGNQSIHMKPKASSS